MSKQYKLSSLQDVYRLIPADKIELCMKEIASGMVQAKLLADLMSAATDSVVPGSIVETFWPDACEWVDDGKTDTTINVSVAGSDETVFTYQNTKA